MGHSEQVDPSARSQPHWQTVIHCPACWGTRLDPHETTLRLCRYCKGNTPQVIRTESIPSRHDLEALLRRR